MTNILLYEVALTLVPNIGAVQARILVDHFGNAEDIFKAKKEMLERIEGIGTVRAKAIRQFSGFQKAEEEIAFIEKYKIKPLFLGDAEYPKLLLNCYDPPTLLYYRGKANLNSPKIIAVIGTRNKTEYGKRMAEKLVQDLAEQQVIVVSGLALGIDALAHKAAIKNNLPTIGVLGHGMDTIYPPEHNALAKEMIKKGGGLLTEFRHDTTPDKHNFPTRNRIVAGISHATVVIETDLKGGSMITAGLADSYNRDVFAFPGKTTDVKSSGCNYLIKNNKAVLITGAADILELMGWQKKETSKTKKAQRELFIQLSEDEKKVMNVLAENEVQHIDELNLKSGLSTSAVAAALLSLELQHIIISLPGKQYKIV